jgi:3-deoxy-D-manno-octulosonic-acid transferase
VLIFYNLFIVLYKIAVWLVALGNLKAKEWVKGREQWAERLESQLDKNNSWIWVHCASAGEFEQGKPVIEKLKTAYPAYKVLVTFFSPSGYNVGKKYKYADHICFLPLDSKQNATQFINIVNPKLVVFVKYDYWYHHLKAVKDRQVPLLLISAIFRESQPFFKWYGGLHKKMLYFFSHLFVQDQPSQELLSSIGVKHSSVSGDTRFDRVVALVENLQPIDYIKEFVGNEKVLVAGSTWPEDEEAIKDALQENNTVKCIIAPHEINPSHIEYLMTLYPSAVKYSQLKNGKQVASNILIIDNIGMLSRLYAYATITYIGGGFNKSGIHNTLEAAVWGNPIIFGPNYNKFKEARDLIDQKAAYSIINAARLKEALQHLLTNDTVRKYSADAAKEYVYQQQGATSTILHYIQEKRLLTN